MSIVCDQAEKDEQGRVRVLLMEKDFWERNNMMKTSRFLRHCDRVLQVFVNGMFSFVLYK